MIAVRPERTVLQVQNPPVSTSSNHFRSDRKLILPEGKRHRVTTPRRAAMGAKEFAHGGQQTHILRTTSVTAVLLLAAVAALLIFTLAIRNPVVQFVLFFVLGSLILALWKVFAEIPWWGWLLFLVTSAVSFIVWRAAHAHGSRPE